MEPVYRPVAGLAYAVCWIMGWDIRVRGAEHVPRHGPAIVAANHVGFLDFVFIGMGARRVRRWVRFMAFERAFRHWLGGPLLRGMRHIPVDRYGDARAALDLAIRALRSGEVVGLHPESRINRTFVPTAGKSGAARMALETAAPLIPCAVWGSQRLWTRGRRELRRGVMVTVDFGPSIAYRPGEPPAEVTERLMGEIRRLAGRAAERYPPRPRGPADRWWLPAHLGGTAPPADSFVIGPPGPDRARDGRHSFEETDVTLG